MDLHAQTSSSHTVPPMERHTHTVIFLHGQESNATQFAEEFFESHGSNDLTLPEIFPSIKWVFPNSGARKTSRFDGYDSQWFDIWDVRNPQVKLDIQIDGLRESIAFILNIIRVEACFVPPERIILGGISQGCAAAIHALLYGGIQLGGFIGLSSWLPMQEEINMKARFCPSNYMLLQRIRTLFKPSTNNCKIIMPSPLNDAFPNSELAFKTPVFLSHSKDDNVIPFANGDMLMWRLEEDLGFDVAWKTIEDGGPRDMDDIVAFLGGVMV